jgi:hypothetical protein
MNDMSREKARKLRIFYLSGIALLIALGLLSRRVKFVPAACGDALWAMMVYCCFRIVLIRKPMIISAVAALITSFAIEFSQMLTPDWLVKIRSTFLGHMLLGQGFLWSDLLAYTIGIAVIYGLTALIRKGVSEK